MTPLFGYAGAGIECHHTRDERPDPAAFGMHAHEGVEIFFFLSGSASFCVEGNLYPLSPGDVMLMRPAETHRIAVDPAEPYERMAFHVLPPPSGWDEESAPWKPFFCRTLGRRNRLSAQDFDSPLFSLCASRLCAPAPADRMTQEDAVHLYLPPMLGELTLAFARAGERLSGSAALPGRPGGADPLTVGARIADYINAHLFEELSLRDISERFFLSQSQVNRVFKTATGSTVWEYILIKRLLAARARIRRGEAAVATCTACGFRDYSSFFRAYRARFGSSPKNDCDGIAPGKMRDQK